MAAFLFSYTVKKIELSHCLEPILFSHVSQTERNEGSIIKSYLSYKEQVKFLSFTLAEGQNC